ncbi:MAG TPA: tetratricopeptide repeat protein [Puia sp.]|nr:tetratricopeptide repeat protein [Puia sp.]
MNKLILLFCLTFPFSRTFSQSVDNKEQARQLKQEAVQIMDNGDPDKAITLLESAQKLDPDDHSYLYEIGYALYLKKDYSKAVDVFKKTTKYPDVTDQCYQMLGNAYDMNGQRNKARDAYADGLKKFPAAGRLYMESGLLDMIEKDYNKAAASWEKGIQVQPDYPSNYYRLTKLFAQTTDRLWAIFYGELFMNIERNTDRTAEISQILFKLYKASITFSDTSNAIKVDLANSNISFDPKKGLKIPFHIVYPMDFAIAVTPAALAPKKEVNIALLSRTRVNLVDIWFNKQKHNNQYPNILLDFHRTLEEKGMLEAYNYWILMKGDEGEFTQWRDSHRKEFDAFAAWFNDNPLQLDTSHYFVRTQYD